MELLQVRMSDAAVVPLLAGLAHEYETRYGPGDEMANAAEEEFDPPGGTFVVLVDDGITLAGGGIRRWSDDTCEVKRLWTAPAHRRRGYASTVLQGLEEAARCLGYSLIRAETGPAQPEALSLYRRLDYGEIPPYGPWVDDTAFERPLTPQQ